MEIRLNKSERDYLKRKEDQHKVLEDQNIFWRFSHKNAGHVWSRNEHLQIVDRRLLLMLNAANMQ